MTIEIEGEFQGIKGKFKRERTAPTIVKSCTHIVDEKTRLFKPNLLITVHGKDDGSTTITEHEIGGGGKK